MFTVNYRSVKSIKQTSLRGLARDIALAGLSFKTKLASSTYYFQKPRVQFLYIHHVFDDELENFEKLLKELFIHHTFISYSQAVEKILTNNVDKPYISISSDDGFKNNIKAAAILDKYNIKACFFINPDSIDLRNPDKVADFCKTRLNFPPTEFMNWDDVSLLLKNGHEIGSHTMGHINVAESSKSNVEENLQESFEIITSKCGKVDHFAYPYGRYFHFNSESLDLVFKTGYKSCASAERGCHISNHIIKAKDLFIRRDHVVCDWNLNHIMYFLLMNSKKINQQNNFNPYQK